MTEKLSFDDWKESEEIQAALIGFDRLREHNNISSVMPEDAMLQIIYQTYLDGQFDHFYAQLKGEIDMT